uniref:Cell division protein n=1 Tax=Caulerpa cliftonii TaxID=1004391 RepID=A0A1C9JBQ1_9CHLO|nr:cell division protein [Caulerpa cliftonii]AOP19278.1 cell division protein [Caulerpa cliftonii]
MKSKNTIKFQYRFLLKFCLILQDIYQTLWYFQRPFLKIGYKTSKQITTLPVFFSFFLMYLGILQVSLETDEYRSCMLKNYPFLITNRISQKLKFETFYFQLSDHNCECLEDWDQTQYIQKGASGPPWGSNSPSGGLFLDPSDKEEYLENDKQEAEPFYNIFRSIIEHPPFSSKIPQKSGQVHYLTEYIKSKYKQNFGWSHGQDVEGALKLHPDFLKSKQLKQSGLLYINSQLWWNFFFHQTFGNLARQSFQQNTLNGAIHTIKKINDQIPWKLESIDNHNPQEAPESVDPESILLQKVFENLDSISDYLLWDDYNWENEKAFASVLPQKQYIKYLKAVTNSLEPDERKGALRASAPRRLRLMKAQNKERASSPKAPRRGTQRGTQRGTRRKRSALLRAQYSLYHKERAKWIYLRKIFLNLRHLFSPIEKLEQEFEEPKPIWTSSAKLSAKGSDQASQTPALRKKRALSHSVDKRNLEILSWFVDFLTNREKESNNFFVKSERLLSINNLVDQQNKFWIKLIHSPKSNFWNHTETNFKGYIKRKTNKAQPEGPPWGPPWGRPSRFQKRWFWDCQQPKSNFWKIKKLKKLKIKKQKIWHILAKRKISGYLFGDTKTCDLALKTLPTIIEMNCNSPNWLKSFSGLAKLNPIETQIESVQLLQTPETYFQYKNHSYSPQDDDDGRASTYPLEGGLIFFELREKVHRKSWLILFLLSSGWLFTSFLQELYKKYAKEILESCIDLLEQAGILEDAQWIKEELGMAKVDKAYRGIRHQSKKISNLIGLNRKNILLQVCDMVWFLKKKKLKASFIGDRGTGTNSYLESTLRSFFSKFHHPDLIQTKPKAFLFTGPPGTGKTLLVQGIAGETGVPVVTQSGGLLLNARQHGRGVRTVQKLFTRAREIAPCIVFIDEVDGIGARRQYMGLNMDIYGRLDIIQFLEGLESDTYRNPPEIQYTKFHLQRRPEYYDDNDDYWKEPELTQTIQSTRVPIEVLQDAQSARSVLKEQFNILTQLLIEMDGINPLDDILIIGATNRLDILDPALLRPGRFQKILTFNLPDYESRINLFKFYTQSSQIGVQNICWDYFSKQTHGLSSADIASIVFASELTAIQQSSDHTLQTLERGIDLITSFPSDPATLRFQNHCIFFRKKIHIFFQQNFCFSFDLNPFVRSVRASGSALAGQKPDKPRSGLSARATARLYNAFQQTKLLEGEEARPLRSRIQNSFQIHRSEAADQWGERSTVLRNCYYNIGKMIWFFCLPKLNFIPSIRLWQRPKNFRFLFLNKKLKQLKQLRFHEFDEFEFDLKPRKDIETTFLSFFGGKAGESILIFCPLNKFIPPTAHPNGRNTKGYEALLSFYSQKGFEQSNFCIEDDIQTAQALLKLMIEKWYFYLETISLEKFHPILENVNSWEYKELETQKLINYALLDEMDIEMDMRNQLFNNEQKITYPAWWMKKVVTCFNYPYFTEEYLKWSRIYLSDPQTSERNVEWVDPDEFYQTTVRIPGYCMTWAEFLERARFSLSNLLLIQSFNTAFTTLRQFDEFIDFLSDSFLRFESLREKDFEFKIQTFFYIYLQNTNQIS